MTAPLPENVRRAGADALEELATRMARGATNLFRQAMRLRIDDSKTHREALCQLRRYLNFEMPGFEQVGIIEGALMGLTEPESRALTERQQREQYQRDADQRKRAREWEQQHPPIPQDASPLNAQQENIRSTIRALKSDLGLLSERLSERETRAAKPRRKRRQKGNVVAGPWGAGEGARP